MSNDNELTLSSNEVKSESTKLALMSNSSMLPTVLGACGTPILFVMEQMMVMYASIGVLSMGLIMMIVNTTLRKSTFENIYVTRRNKQIEKDLKKKRERLRKTLNSSSAKEQITAFENKYNHFTSSLSNELSPESYSYQRLLGAFDQVFQVGLDKIEKVWNYEKNQATIDQVRILKEMHPLRQKESSGTLNSVEQEKLNTLQASLDLRESYNTKIDEIIAQNEQALSKMNELQQTLTDLHKPQNMKIAMEELAGLARALNFEETNKIKLD